MNTNIIEREFCCTRDGGTTMQRIVLISAVAVRMGKVEVTEKQPI